MSQIDHDVSAIDCLFETILGFMLPFFLVGAGGSPDIAGAAVRELIDAYGAGTSTELDLVGRIVGFSIAALDNLRLSMTTGMSDTKVLRYRCNAVTLSRASDQARTILEAVQAKPEQIRAEVDEFAKSYEDPKEVVRWYYSNQQRLAEMEAYVVESNVVDFVLGKARVSDKEVSFEELASATAQA